ncbi:MAG: GIY-YIG nuclease family protein [Chlorobi bacterium]|nr:GIY-YIG nuclease family protein [Chlorobiota bacterium]
MYTIVDIETTGGSRKHGKITEIAIYKFNGQAIVGEFVSLINPEKYIPSNITQLTGITNEMVEDAPKFYEVAKQIVEITEGTVFVAHNAPFDYNFLKAEFESLGYDFDRQTLCTVKLSRNLLPGYRSYSLGNLCEELGIKNDARHRAAGDALATVELFKILLKQNNGIILPDDPYARFSADSLHPMLSIERLKMLPEKTGVYFLHNEDGDVLYIGKSKNIRRGVLAHFGNPKTKKGVELKQKTADISYFITGSELVALLMESEEIKRYKPPYNRAQRKRRVSFGLYSYFDRKRYHRLMIKKNSGLDTPLASFETMKEATNKLFDWVDEFELCQQLCGLYDGGRNGCFRYGLKQCNGACVGEEPAEVYNTRVEKLLQELSCRFNNAVIIDKGKNRDDVSLVVIENGTYLGYGWMEKDNPVSSAKEFKEFIEPMEDNRDVRKIISGYLKSNKPEKIIEY